MDELRKPPPELVDEALRFPGGWIYEIDGDFESTEAVPPEFIGGAWAVGSTGKLTGEYKANPEVSTLD